MKLQKSSRTDVKKIIARLFFYIIVRPPLVYVKGCPENYQILKLGVIPRPQNKKSILYVDNLCELIYQIYIKKPYEIFMPQNSEIQFTIKSHYQ